MSTDIPVPIELRQAAEKTKPTAKPTTKRGPLGTNRLESVSFSVEQLQKLNSILPTIREQKEVNNASQLFHYLVDYYLDAATMLATNEYINQQLQTERELNHEKEAKIKTLTNKIKELTTTQPTPDPTPAPTHPAITSQPAKKSFLKLLFP